MFFEPGQHKQHGLPYNPFKALVVPRPIGWITTIGSDGVVNLAPYSFFNGLSDAPPMVFFASNGKPRSQDGGKDSLRNAEESGEFVVNLVTWDLREAMNATAAPLPPGESELERTKLTLASSEKVSVPRIADSPAHLECRWIKTVDLPCTLPDTGNHMVIGEVVGIHIEESLLTDKGLVDLARARPVGRLGYMDYTVVDTIFAMERPKR
ncbi:flavin reductase family protein [Aquibaculum arenosum]|uniref:Flavin reductase family protein n=1 Tax=Aquibaculum arenosum TaxID=3032591 RepID=A0ABT5YLL1_9PROT|nr:flavin reductase family protein [Fodinicurvata sp. CAU 1616]MDF2095841.1 flavin reductase family protein [Fodinicurvata sp. CAU 1616]